MYSEFACIVDYLIDNYSKDKFLLYMKKLTMNNDIDKIFKQIFVLDYNDFLLNFRKSVEENDTIKMTHDTTGNSMMYKKLPEQQVIQGL